MPDDDSASSTIGWVLDAEGVPTEALRTVHHGHPILAGDDVISASAD